MYRIYLLASLVAMCLSAGCADQGLQSGQEPSVSNGRVVVVFMAGWLESELSLARIESAVRKELVRRLPGRSNHRISIRRKGISLLLEGDYDLFLRLEYNAWMKRKKTPAGQYDEFVAIGHSSGATAIYNELRNGTFKSGRCMPAFLGLVDMVLPMGDHNLAGKIPRSGGGKTRVVHYAAAGTPRIRGVRNIRVPGASHLSILNSSTVTRGLARDAAGACVRGLASQRLSSLGSRSALDNRRQTRTTAAWMRR